MPKQKSKLCRYKYHSTQKKNHKRQVFPVVVPIKIDTTPSLNFCESNRKSTKMELATELDLYLKSHVASEHNYKQEIVYIEEARQELYHQDKIRSKDKEKITALGVLLEDSSKA